MDYKKGRGAQINTHNRFLQHSYETEDDYLEFLRINGEDTSLERKTQYLEVFPKTILNKVTSPDLRGEWSMNPYQGCEHGCTRAHTLVGVALVSELGGPSGKSFRLVRACARCVCLVRSG